MLNQHQTIKNVIQQFNKPNPLIDYLVPLIGDKKEVKIADIGSGPLSTIGHLKEGVEVKIYNSDKQTFKDFYEKYNIEPYAKIEYQDMEKLTYPDSFFDIVHSANALDHTVHALAALKEMIRVCKPGGWVYIECNLDQLSTGGKHYWNAKADGKFINHTEQFDLKDFGFKIKFIDRGGESRYNQIIATLNKVQ